MQDYLHYFIDIHSLVRYLVLLLTGLCAAQSLVGLLRKQQFTDGNRKIALSMMIACDVQLLVGLVVYSGQLPLIKAGTAFQGHYNIFYTVEHPVSMILGIMFVHFAYAAAKKSLAGERKFKRVFWYAFIALFLFVAQTPWPSKPGVGKPWIPEQAMAS